MTKAKKVIRELTRKCTKCKVFKVLETEFHKRADVISGYRSVCRTCRNEQNRRVDLRYLDRKEYVREINRKFRLANPSYMAEYSRKYRQRKDDQSQASH